MYRIHRMSRIAALGLACVMMFTAWGCEKPGEVFPEVNEDLPLAGEKVLTKLKAGFDVGLKEALKSDGKLEGAHTTNDAKAAKTDGVSAINLKFGRTSSRLRNPANAIPTWAVRTIKELDNLKTHKLEKSTYLFDVGKGRRGYIEAIGLAIECIRCHGLDSALGEGMKKRVEGEFPEDKAMGYKGGQLRGWYWLEYDAAK